MTGAGQLSNKGLSCESPFEPAQRPALVCKIPQMHHNSKLLNGALVPLCMIHYKVHGDQWRVTVGHHLTLGSGHAAKHQQQWQHMP